MNQSSFVVVEGPIGVGKTTLARLMQPHFGMKLLLEVFEENPFLADFYADRARYAFQTQIFFLLSRYHQQQAVRDLLARDPLVADYTFEKDKLFAQLNLAGDELAIYTQLYDLLCERIVAPDLIVYLHADIDTLMTRIAVRDRVYERDLDRSYIERLADAYEQYFADYTKTRVLKIDTTHLNYVSEPDALSLVTQRIQIELESGLTS